MDVIPPNLSECKRSKLQALCKKLHIPANLKTVVLIERLEEARTARLCQSRSDSESKPVVLGETGATKDNDVFQVDICIENNAMDTAAEGDGPCSHGGATVKANTSGGRKRKRLGDNTVVSNHDSTTITDGDESFVTASDGAEFACSEAVTTPTIDDSMGHLASSCDGSVRKKRKHWCEVDCNESIDEMMERLVNTPPPPGKTSSSSRDSGRSSNQCSKKRRRRSTYDKPSPSVTPDVIEAANCVLSTDPVLSSQDDDDAKITTVGQTPTGSPVSSNRSSLSSQFIIQQYTTQAMSPLVTSLMTASQESNGSCELVVHQHSSGSCDDNDGAKRMDQISKLLDERVKLRKSQGHDPVQSCSSRIPIPGVNSGGGQTRFDQSHKNHFSKMMSIKDHHNRRVEQKKLATPLHGSSATNKHAYSFKKNMQFTGEKLPTDSVDGVFKFKAANRSKDCHKSGRCPKSVVRRSAVTASHEMQKKRKSYNATGKIKRPVNYTPYTGKVAPIKPITNH